MDSPRFYKSHLPAKFFKAKIKDSKKCRCLVAMRNPKDMLVSYWYFAKKLFSSECSIEFDEIFDKFCKDELVFGDWFAHVKSWWSLREDPNVLLLRYEELKTQHRDTILKIANFLEIDAKDDFIDEVYEKTTFENMQADPKINMNSSNWFEKSEQIQFMRKGNVGDWRNYFSEEQSTIVNERLRQEFKDSELEEFFREYNNDNF